MCSFKYIEAEGSVLPLLRGPRGSAGVRPGMLRMNDHRPRHPTHQTDGQTSLDEWTGLDEPGRVDGSGRARTSPDEPDEGRRARTSGRVDGRVDEWTSSDEPSDEPGRVDAVNRTGQPSVGVNTPCNHTLCGAFIAGHTRPSVSNLLNTNRPHSPRGRPKPRLTHGVRLLMQPRAAA